MPNYMLMLYAPEVDPDAQAEREAELPLWLELNDSLQEAGLLVATVVCTRWRPPRRSACATARRSHRRAVRGRRRRFSAATTLLECRRPRRGAASRPRGCRLARYGSVEVRPVMDVSELVAPTRRRPDRRERSRRAAAGIGDPAAAAVARRFATSARPCWPR